MEILSAVLRIILLVVIIAFGIIKCTQRYIISNFDGKGKSFIISAVSILVVYATWGIYLFNKGWIRLFMTVLLLPFIHGAVFFKINVSCAKHFYKSRKLKRLNFWFVVTYIFSNLSMPDFNDFLWGFFLFRPIQNNVTFVSAFAVSAVVFAVHIFLLVKQIKEIKRVNGE